MAKCEDKNKKTRKPVGTMNVALVIVCIAAIAFTASMIYLFMMVGSIPDTLCTCVFAVLGGECGVLGWIKTTKERNQDRKWAVQDRQEEQTLIKEMEEARDV